jgi:hypothetical protein
MGEGTVEKWLRQNFTSFGSGESRAFTTVGPIVRPRLMAFREPSTNHLKTNSRPKLPLSKAGSVHRRRQRLSLPPEVIADSLSVDAACDGSPGNLELRGDKTGIEVYVGSLKNGTNKLESFAIVHAL